MLENKIITLDNGVEYYIFETIEYDFEKYVLCAKCDTKNDTMDTEELLLRKIILNGDNVAIKSIENDEIAKKVTELIIAKAQQNNE